MKITTFILLLCLSVSTFASGEKRRQKNRKKEDKLTGEQKRQMKELSQMAWNIQEYNMYKDNEKLLKRLEKRVENNQVIGLELVIAASTDLRFESRWGHSMLRFVDNKGAADNDLVLGFIAELDNPKTNYFKGMFGTYPVYPILNSLGGFVEQYIKGEDRALDRYILPTTPALIKELVGHLRTIQNELYSKNEASYKKQKSKLDKKLKRLLKKKKFKGYKSEKIEVENRVVAYALEKGDKSHFVALKIKPKKSKALGGYTFLKNNCAGALVRFLRETIYPFLGAVKWKGRVPVKMQEYFSKHYMMNFPKTTIPSLGEFKSKIAKLVGKEYSQLYEYEGWMDVNFSDLMNKLSTKELMLLMSEENLGILPDQQDLALERLAQTQNKPDYDGIYGIKTLPKQLYEICLDQTCAKAQKDVSQNLYKPLEVRNILERKHKIKKKFIDNSIVQWLKVYHEVLMSTF